MIDLRIYDAADVPALTAELAIRVEASRRQWREMWSRIRDFKFRTPGGMYWTIGLCSRQWYRFSEGRWEVSRRGPTGRLEGPDWIAGLGDVSTVAQGCSAVDKADAVPLDPTRAIEANVTESYAQYTRGDLSASDVHGLLEPWILVDRTGDLWAFGCRSQQWYLLIEGKWVSQPGPPDRSLLPDASESLELSEQQTMKQVEFIARDIPRLPEPVTEPWIAPPNFPEMPPPVTVRCAACGQVNLAGSHHCSECAAPLPDDGKATADAARCGFDRGVEKADVAADAGLRRRVAEVLSRVREPTPEQIREELRALPVEPKAGGSAEGSPGPRPQPQPLCTACGAPLRGGLAFCTQCGQRITNG